MTLRETIKNLTREHLISGGTLHSQALTAVGWIAGTVPQDLPNNKGLYELPTSDASNGGIVCGFALGGRRPIYVIRYQGFLWYNAVSLVNYAAKSKEFWGVPCPIFIRALGMEGGIGPVAGGMHHSMIMRMPGIKVVAPMTPNEYTKVWTDFLGDDDPVFCSEHRSAYNIDSDFEEINPPNQTFVIYAIGAARIEAYKAAQHLNKYGIHVSLKHIVHLSPLDLPQPPSYALKVYVIDSDYITCGAASTICYEIAKNHPGTQVEALGLENRSAGFSPDTDNVTPSAQKIIDKVTADYQNYKNLFRDLLY